MKMTKGSIVKNELHDKIRQIEQGNNIKFSNTQKVLLSIEGSITAILDVLYGTVSIFTIKQKFEKADGEKSELLRINKDEEIHVREVLIHGKVKPMIYALSYIPLSRCPNKAREDIEQGRLPMGKIFKKHHVESRREINDIYIEEPSATLKELFHTSEKFISRDYIVIKDNEIIMWTKESFPISYFSNEI